MSGFEVIVGGGDLVAPTPPPPSNGRNQKKKKPGLNSVKTTLENANRLNKG